MTKLVSVLTGGTNQHPTTSADLNGVATDFISSGVVGSLTNTAGVAPNTGNFAVNAQGTPNTTTAVSAGVAYITATPVGSVSQSFRVSDDTGTTVTHAANSSGATRYDWIYVSLDASALATPSSDGSSPLTYTVSRSTSNTTDNGTPPTYGTPIAVVTLSNGFVTVTNANIADKRVQAGANKLAPSTITGAMVSAGAIVGIDAPTFNPIPGGTAASPVDVTGSSVTFTLPVASYLVITHCVNNIQINASDTVDYYLNVDGSRAGFANITASNPSGSTYKFPGSRTQRISLAAGSHTIKLQTGCNSATNCVLVSPSWWAVVTNQV